MRYLLLPKIQEEERSMDQNNEEKEEDISGDETEDSEEELDSEHDGSDEELESKEGGFEGLSKFMRFRFWCCRIVFKLSGTNILLTLLLLETMWLPNVDRFSKCFCRLFEK